MEYEPRISVVRKSLLELKMFSGVEKKIAVFNGTVAIAVTIGAKTLYYVPVAFFWHFILRWFYKKDPYIRLVYQKSNVLGRVYDPWPHRKMTTNSRPAGFSKGLLC